MLVSFLFMFTSLYLAHSIFFPLPLFSLSVLLRANDWLWVNVACWVRFDIVCWSFFSPFMYRVIQCMRLCALQQHVVFQQYPSVQLKSVCLYKTIFFCFNFITVFISYIEIIIKNRFQQNLCRSTGDENKAKRDSFIKTKITKTQQ